MKTKSTVKNGKGTYLLTQQSLKEIVSISFLCTNVDFIIIKYFDSL